MRPILILLLLSGCTSYSTPATEQANNYADTSKLSPVTPLPKEKAVLNASQSGMIDEVSPETSHPKAKALLKEEFYWSPIEETAPFGSDDGADAFYQFRDWRATNRTSSPFLFIHALLARWEYGELDLSTPDTGAGAGDRHMLGRDNVVIAVGFGQFVLEGTIDKELLIQTKRAIKRECTPLMLDEFAEHYRVKRLAQLTTMLQALDKIK